MFNMQSLTNKVGRRKLEGFFIGKVKDIKDPLLLNRVKVDINELTHNKIDKKYLPWYSVQYPLSSTYNNKSFLPPVDSYVRVEFPTVDFYNGIVTGMLPKKPADIG